MSVDLETQREEVSVALPQESRPRRRRWAWGLVIGVLLIVVGALIGRAVYLDQYEPLAIGGSGSSGLYGNPEKEDVDGTVRAYTYHEGGIIPLSLWISNEGPLGVAVTGIERNSPGWRGLVSLVGARLGDERRPLDLESSRPFSSFSLSPDDSRLVQVLFRMGNCRHNEYGGAMHVTSVRVKFTVLGVQRSQDLPLSEGIWVDAPRPEDCPAGSSPAG